MAPRGLLLLVGLVLLSVGPLSAKRLFHSNEDLTPGAKDDQILTLPGYGTPNKLPTRHFSGYVEVDKEHGRNLFYYFVESERDPVNDPVVLWLNGGPGCSSFDGFIFEHGPFDYDLVAHDRGYEVRLHDNPYAWNKVANVLFLDSPAGVGLSYSETPQDYSTNDSRTAADANEFLRRWFERFPQYQPNRFFISGESYAGIYVPNLARAVVNGNLAKQEPHINIEGYLVGNGCTDQRYDGNAHPLFAMGKSLISYKQFSSMQEACAGGEYWNTSGVPMCGRLLSDLWAELAALNLYDILEDCFHDTPAAATAAVGSALRHTAGGVARRLTSFAQQQAAALLGGGSGSGASSRWAAGSSETASETTPAGVSRARLVDALRSSGLLGVWPLPGGAVKPGKVLNWAHVQQRLGLAPPCTDARVGDIWLNDPSVRSALHAAPKSVIGPWTLCSDKIDYTREGESMIPIHRNLTSTHGLRALIYSGDHDLCVPHTGSEGWTSDLGYKVLKQWQPWFVADHQVAGYYVSYEHGLSYATVKGAGHMVPETNPREALAMLQRFLEKGDLAHE